MYVDSEGADLTGNQQSARPSDGRVALLPMLEQTGKVARPAGLTLFLLGG